jgi:hypothetical protein
MARARTKEEFDAALEAERATRRNAFNIEQSAFAQRVEARRVALAQGAPITPTIVPTFNDLYNETRAKQLAALAAEQAAQISNMTPKQRWLATLDAKERRRIQTWEHINKMDFFEVTAK